MQAEIEGVASRSRFPPPPPNHTGCHQPGGPHREAGIRYDAAAARAIPPRPGPPCQPQAHGDNGGNNSGTYDYDHGDGNGGKESRDTGCPRVQRLAPTRAAPRALACPGLPPGDARCLSMTRRRPRGSPRQGAAARADGSTGAYLMRLFHCRDCAGRCYGTRGHNTVFTAGGCDLSHGAKQGGPHCAALRKTTTTKALRA